MGGLQAANNDAVSEFVRDWRKAYPDPTKENLDELRKIQQLIRKNKLAAVRMTQAYKIENIEVCSNAVRDGVYLSMPECQPGL